MNITKEQLQYHVAEIDPRMGYQYINFTSEGAVSTNCKYLLIVPYAAKQDIDASCVVDYTTAKKACGVISKESYTVTVDNIISTDLSTSEETKGIELKVGSSTEVISFCSNLRGKTTPVNYKNVIPAKGKHSILLNVEYIVDLISKMQKACKQDSVRIYFDVHESGGDIFCPLLIESTEGGYSNDKSCTGVILPMRSYK